MSFDQIISTLPQNIKDILRQLQAGGRTLSPRELLRLLSFLLASGGAYRATIWQALIWLANAGNISVPTLVEAATLMAEGEGASVVAGSGAAEAAGLSGAALAATVAAILAALVAAGYAYYNISTELKTKVEPAKAGLPCTVKAGPTGTVFTLSRSGIGSRTSYNRAVRAAEAYAASVVTCSGNCTAPASCVPVAIVISVDPKYRVFWTTTVVTYMVGCACL